MSGTVSGGWSFVWSAYGITAAVLGLYAVHVVAMFRGVSKSVGHMRP